MSDLVKPQPGDRILELGTGSGYQAAVLAELTGHVRSIETVEPLGRQITRRLSELGYDNVTVRVGDSYYGWEEHAPFDAIVVTAAASYVPPPLVAQLKPGGLMVIPVGRRFLTQQLVLIEKQPGGELVTRQILPVKFVPLTAILILGILYLISLDSMIDTFSSLPDFMRILISAALIAPLAFFMGMPFLLGLGRLADYAPGISVITV